MEHAHRHIPLAANAGGRMVLGLGGSLYGLTLAVVGARIYTRLAVVRCFGADDWAMAAAAVAMTALHALVAVGVREYGLGTPKELADPASAAGLMQVLFSVPPVMCACQALMRVSLILTTLRFARGVASRGYCRAIYGCLALAVLSTATDLTLLGLNCALERGRVCIRNVHVYMAPMVINIVMNVLVLGLPMPFLWQLRIRRRRKFALMAVFALGSTACIAGVLKMLAMEKAHATGNIWSGPPHLWSLMEIDIGILCGSLPPLKSLYSHIRSKTTRHRNIRNSQKSSITPLPPREGGFPATDPLKFYDELGITIRSVENHGHHTLPRGGNHHGHHDDDGDGDITRTPTSQNTIELLPASPLSLLSPRASTTPPPPKCNDYKNNTDEGFGDDAGDEERGFSSYRTVPLGHPEPSVAQPQPPSPTKRIWSNILTTLPGRRTATDTIHKIQCHFPHPSPPQSPSQAHSPGGRNPTVATAAVTLNGAATTSTHQSKRFSHLLTGTPTNPNGTGSSSSSSTKREWDTPGTGTPSTRKYVVIRDVVDATQQQQQQQPQSGRRRTGTFSIGSRDQVRAPHPPPLSPKSPPRANSLQNYPQLSIPPLPPVPTRLGDLGVLPPGEGGDRIDNYRYMDWRGRERGERGDGGGGGAGDQRQKKRVYFLKAQYSPEDYDVKKEGGGDRRCGGDLDLDLDVSAQSISSRGDERIEDTDPEKGARSSSSSSSSSRGGSSQPQSISISIPKPKPIHGQGDIDRDPDEAMSWKEDIR
ncbi:hypothetical protein DFH27DRAFT_384643 [Peziza echinospora]|nr:hypothetical protein DFH27DRAFT_384643 [Peziza echinospora]